MSYEDLSNDIEFGLSVKDLNAKGDFAKQTFDLQLSTNFMLDSVPHRIEHIYDVEVQDRSAILNSILIFVLVLLILAIFVRFVFKGKSSQVSGTEVKIKN